jgi:hypothetical protein
MFLDRATVEKQNEAGSCGRRLGQKERMLQRRNRMIETEN